MGKKAILDLLLGCSEIQNDPNQSAFVAQAAVISEDAKKPKPASAINQAQGKVSSTLRLQTEAGLKCTKIKKRIAKLLEDTKEAVDTLHGAERLLKEAQGAYSDAVKAE